MMSLEKPLRSPTLMDDLATSKAIKAKDVIVQVHSTH